jgi:Cd2+/Zn2+-exporting ATPase
LIASISAFFLILIPPHHGEFPEALAVILFYQLGETLNDRAIDHSQKAIKSLIEIQKNEINLVVDGAVKVVPIKDVKIDSLIAVNPGDILQLDGIVVDGKTNINTSTINGEFTPVEVHKDMKITSGSIILDSPITVKTTTDSSNSVLSKIAALIKQSLNDKSKSETFIAKFARIYTPVVCCIALLCIILLPIILGINSGEV